MTDAAPETSLLLVAALPVPPLEVIERSLQRVGGSDGARAPGTRHYAEARAAWELDCLGALALCEAQRTAAPALLIAHVPRSIEAKRHAAIVAAIAELLLREKFVLWICDVCVRWHDGDDIGVELRQFELATS